MSSVPLSVLTSNKPCPDTYLEGEWEVGTRPKSQQGRRSDLEAVAQAIKEQKTLKQIADEHTATFIRYSSGITKTAELLRQVQQKEKMVALFFGPPGCGKSHKVPVLPITSQVRPETGPAPLFATWPETPSGTKSPFPSEQQWGNSPSKTTTMSASASLKSSKDSWDYSIGTRPSTSIQSRSESKEPQSPSTPGWSVLQQTTTPSSGGTGRVERTSDTLLFDDFTGFSGGIDLSETLFDLNGGTPWDHLTAWSPCGIDSGSCLAETW